MRRSGHWLVVTDAGPAYKGPYKANVPFLIAYRIHADDTQERPFAMGSALIAESGVNRAEYMAAIRGLTLVRDMIELEGYANFPVVVLTDSLVVALQRTGPVLTPYWAQLTEVGDELRSITGHRVQILHDPSEAQESHSLLSRFRGICDKSVRDYWSARKRREWATFRGET